MSGDSVGFVVVEYNQASRRPGLPTGTDLFDSQEAAEAFAADERRQTASVGRGEWYAVAEVVLVDDELS